MDICGPCKFRNIDAKATEYCLTCQESQCKSCAEIHGSSKATRTHMLLRITDLHNPSKTTEDLEKFQSCIDHPEKMVEFYCVYHEHFMCSKCLLNLQKLDCKNIVDIGTAGENLVKAKVHEQITKDLECVEEHCKNEEGAIQILIDESHKEKQEIQTYFENIKQQIINHFNKCEKEILDEVSKNVTAEVAELCSKQTVLRETRQTAEVNKDILQKIMHSNSKADIFRCILSITQQLGSPLFTSASSSTDISTHSVKLSPAMDELLNSMNVGPIVSCRKVTNTKTFTSNVKMNMEKELFKQIVKQVALMGENEEKHDYVFSSADGEMEEPTSEIVKETIEEGEEFIKQNTVSTSSSNDYVNKSSRIPLKFHMTDVLVTTPDSKKANISGIIMLMDGCFVLSDSKSLKLIRLKQDLTYKDTADLSHIPGDMTVLNDKHLVVCLPTANRIAFVAVSQELKWIRNFKTQHMPKAVHALDANRLLVSQVNAIDGKCHLQILTTDGALRQDIGITRFILDASQVSSLKLNLTSPRYYLQCCRASNALYCFETKGKEVFRYSVTAPKFLYVDAAGKIFVLDSKGVLHVLANNGKLLLTIAVPEDVNAVTCNKKGNTVFATRQSSAVICAFGLTI